MRVRITKPFWVNGEPLNVGATVNLKPRMATDLIQIGAAVDFDPEQSGDVGSTPTRSTNKKKKEGEKDETDREGHQPL